MDMANEAVLDWYSVTIPYWSEGCPLTLTGIRAVSRRDAVIQAIQWVNRYAGYHYCDALPAGSRAFVEAGR